MPTAKNPPSLNAVLIQAEGNLRYLQLCFPDEYESLQNQVRPLVEALCDRIEERKSALYGIVRQGWRSAP
jgi:hypothetical protein